MINFSRRAFFDRLFAVTAAKQLSRAISTRIAPTRREVDFFPVASFRAAKLDGDFIYTREFTHAQIAAIFSVPPHMIADAHRFRVLPPALACADKGDL